MWSDISAGGFRAVFQKGIMRENTKETTPAPGKKPTASELQW